MSMEGTNLMPINIVHQGVLTRTVRDTAAFYAAAERFYRNPRLPPMGYVKQINKARLRVIFFDNPLPGRPGHIDEDSYRVQLETARFLESLGHRVERIKVPVNVEEMTRHFLNYYGLMAYVVSHWGEWVFGAKVDKAQLETFTLGLARRFRKNVLEMPKSIAILLKTAAETDRLFESSHDILMTPVGAQKTPAIGYFAPDLSYDEICRRAADYAPYTGLHNVTGSPSISLPLGTASDGMPIGVQFTAQKGQDQRLLELAYELEAAKPWKMMHEVARNVD